MNDLSEIGIEKNVHYECITTTIDKNGKKMPEHLDFSI